MWEVLPVSFRPSHCNSPGLRWWGAISSAGQTLSNENSWLPLALKTHHSIPANVFLRDAGAFKPISEAPHCIDQHSEHQSLLGT